MVAFRSSVSSTRSTSGTGFSVSVPAGVQEGDFLFAFIVWFQPPGTINTPSGWAQDTTGTLSNGNYHFRRFWKIASASEPPTYNFTTSGSSSRAVAVMGAYSNLEYGHPNFLRVDVTSHSDASVTSHRFNGHLIGHNVSRYLRTCVACIGTAPFAVASIDSRLTVRETPTVGSGGNSGAGILYADEIVTDLHAANLSANRNWSSTAQLFITTNLSTLFRDEYPVGAQHVANAPGRKRVVVVGGF